MIEFFISFFLIFSGCVALNALIVHSNLIGGVVKKLLFVPSPKSTSGAVLLGGLPLAIASGYVFYSFSSNLEMFLGWLIPAIILVGIGYLDDKVEIKPYVKLSLQVLAVCSFSFFAAGASELNLGLFAIYSVWGFGVLSGSNLLDGIDTYSIKYSIGSYAAFIAFGLYFGHTDIAIMSGLLIGPKLAFYIYNKYPSKMHLGEIGGTIIGLNCLFLSNLLFKGFEGGRAIASVSDINFEILLLTLSVLHLPMTELGISLLRRLAAMKSPFHGDKLHLHYIMASDKKVGVVKAANYLSSLHIQALVINIAVAYYISPVSAFLVSGIFYVAYYVFFGKETWAKDMKVIDVVEEKIANVFSLPEIEIANLKEVPVKIKSNDSFKNTRSDFYDPAYDPGGGCGPPPNSSQLLAS